jgi:hypothetical protein
VIECIKYDALTQAFSKPPKKSMKSVTMIQIFVSSLMLFGLPLGNFGSSFFPKMFKQIFKLSLSVTLANLPHKQITNTWQLDVSILHSFRHREQDTLCSTMFGRLKTTL